MWVPAFQEGQGAMCSLISSRSVLSASNTSGPALAFKKQCSLTCLRWVHLASFNSRWRSFAIDAMGDPFSAGSSEKPFQTLSREGEALSSGQPLSPDPFEEIFFEPGMDPFSVREWELDFFSRPILDARGKRMWELVVCDSRRKLRFARFYPNNAINSITLKSTVLYIMNTLKLPKPQKLRYFRYQMETVISKVCNELDIQSVPSRRCVSLMRWLDERYSSVYRQHPGFQEGAASPLQLEQSNPLELPDALRGEQWAFVQLPLPGVLEEVAAVEKGSTFGSIFSLDTLGLKLPGNAVIPGVAVASTRATPLAAWTNTLELASLHVDRRKACVVLSTGVTERWLYAFYRRSRQADQEAEAWQATKKACGGLHFLAVQQSLDSDICTGFWLLFDVPMPRV
eukprot:c4163_g1_i1 orf=330-1523(+)